MKANRRQWIKAAGALGASGAAGFGAPGAAMPDLGPIMNGQVLRTELLKEPILIETLELLRAEGRYIVRVRGKNGHTGYADAHSRVMQTAFPIIVKQVFPHFAGKDARDLERLLDAAYLGSYKWQGLPLWVSIAATEMAVLDLIGKSVSKPMGELLGAVARRKIAVYRASSHRGNSPEAEVEYLHKQMEETGAKAVKYRLGARMRYDAASTKRDLALIPLTRKAFGEGVTIYADANGSYDVAMGIRIGKLMEEHGHAFFEEPAPFDYYDETKAIADALTIPIALGEVEMSLRGFRRMIETGTAQVIQPDLMYFGGMIRSIKVARMAAAAGLDCTPHMSGGGLGYLYVAHFASCVPNAGAHQEYKGEGDTLPVSSETSSLKSEGGMLTVPSGPGLGVTIDPEFLKKGVAVKV